MNNAISAIVAAIVVCGTCLAVPVEGNWLARSDSFPYHQPKEHTDTLILLRQDWWTLHLRQSVLGTPMTICNRVFKHGLGTHSFSHIRVRTTEPISRFNVWVGLDDNEQTRASTGSVTFAVKANGKELASTGVLHVKDEAQRIDVDAGGTRVLDLYVGDGGDSCWNDQANWADASVTLEDGRTIWLDEMQTETSDFDSRYPFSFSYGGKSSDGLLDSWKCDRSEKKLDADRTQITSSWTDPQSGLKVSWEGVRYSDFPAIEWVLWFENTGSGDTDIIEGIRDLDIAISSPFKEQSPYLLHTAKGGLPDSTEYQPRVTAIKSDRSVTIGSGTGRSSTKNFPFFKIETGEGSFVVAVGWSGCWDAKFEASPDTLHASAGIEKTSFKLHPGEKIRTSRILVLEEGGDTLESNALFRQLIYKHYTAKRNGVTPLPIPFCNTCFTRGGIWLNECNEQNQISLINAYGDLGLEALLTDAGWFTGGWPDGAGNWDPRKDAYPNGMRPVAAAAKKRNMIYGLWFEPERVVVGTSIHKEHPEWCLGDPKGGTLLLNFGLTEVQDHFFNIVDGFMQLPGFRIYRQDFNMDPLPYWRNNDAPDRQGITEIKYIMGMYAYWDRILKTYPDAFMEECASGGHRIDLETVMHLHAAQKADYWFHDETDQSSLWSVSQYLPNNTIVAHLNVLDDYSFHSTLASSLCFGWIADAPDFDKARGKQILERYKEIRPLLVGAWYPLLPGKQNSAKMQDSMEDVWGWESDPTTGWVGSQYHRPDLNKGMLLIFRREDSPYSTAQVTLHGLNPNATYELTSDRTGKKWRTSGSALMQELDIMLPDKRSSDLISYKVVD